LDLAGDISGDKSAAIPPLTCDDLVPPREFESLLPP
jgi:hypothetical protein